MTEASILFTPSTLADADRALRQNLMLGQCSWYAELCRLLPVPVLVLNDDDVVVQANPALLRLAGLPQDTDVVGAAVDPDHLADLGLHARPLRAGGEAFRLLSTDEAGGRPAISRAFFHDLMNTAGSVRGLSEVMAESGADDVPRLSASVRDLAGQALEEIAAHRDLAAAARGDLRVDVRSVDAGEALRLVAARFHGHPLAGDRQIVIVPGADAGSFATDPVLLGRILGNMVKNALEAIPDGAVVTLDCGRRHGSVWFSVHNAGEIPADQQARLFRQAASAKGRGRGVGTWSMRVLAESYLRGRGTVSSNAAHGTTFTVSLPADGS